MVPKGPQTIPKHVRKKSEKCPKSIRKVSQTCPKSVPNMSQNLPKCLKKTRKNHSRSSPESNPVPSGSNSSTCPRTSPLVPPLPLKRWGEVGLSPVSEKTPSPFQGLENGRKHGYKMSPKKVPKWMQNGAIMASSTCRRHSGHGLCAKRLTFTKHHYLWGFVNIFMIMWRSIAAALVHKMQKRWLEQGLEKHIEHHTKKSRKMSPKRYPKWRSKSGFLGIFWGSVPRDGPGWVQGVSHAPQRVKSCPKRCRMVSQKT